MVASLWRMRYSFQHQDISMSSLVENTQRLFPEVEPVECTIQHYFNNGVYIRESTIPADTAVLGYIHKESCLNILSKGSMLVKDTEDEEYTLIEAPFTFISEAGVQKIAITITECVFSNIHNNVTGTTDIEELENKHTYKEETNELLYGSRGSSRSGILNNGGKGSS